MENKYLELKARHQKEIDALPIKAAFSSQQFNEMMKNFGLSISSEDCRKIYSIGYGCYAKLEDKEKIDKCFDDHDKELTLFLEDYDNLKQAFEYELGNHEFCYTYDPTDTLRSLGFTYDDILHKPMVEKAFNEAKKKYLEWCDKHC